MTGTAGRGSATPTLSSSVVPRLRVVRSSRSGWSLAFDPVALRRTSLLMVGLVAVTCYALSVGTIEVPPEQLLRVLTGGGDDVSRLVVLEWRMPRVLTAVLAGAALGMAGAIVQRITRNPLGSPDVIGFSAGSYFGVLMVVVVWHGAAGARGLGAVGGGLLAAALVWLLAYRGGVTGFRLILIGIGVSSLLTGMSTWLTLRSTEDEFKTFVYWSAGSLDGLTWSSVGPLLIVLGLLITVALALGRQLRQLELGDRVARTQGIRLEWVRGVALGTGILLTAVVTATCGPLDFVALAAPHIARRVVGGSSVALLASAVVGALLVSIADLIGDQFLPVPLPTGVVTLVFGGVYLTFLLFREARTR